MNPVVLLWAVRLGCTRVMRARVSPPTATQAKAVGQVTAVKVMGT